MQKRCPKCGEEKELSEFYNNSHKKDGKTVYCKACITAYSHNHYQQNKEKYKESLQRWRNNNREYVRERDKKYRQENPDIEFAKQKRYRENHQDKLYIKNKTYREEHRDYFRQKYRERKEQVKSTDDGSITKDFLKELLEDQNYKCDYCGCELNQDNMNIDHIIPLSRGGTHTSDNIHYVCRECNASKNDKLESEWIFRNYTYTPEQQEEVKEESP